MVKHKYKYVNTYTVIMYVIMYLMGKLFFISQYISLDCAGCNTIKISTISKIHTIMFKPVTTAKIQDL